MRLLLDTHALIWWLAGDESLSSAAQEVIANPEHEVFVSAASAWEISTKHRIGKMPHAAALAADVAAVVAGQGFAELPITLRHAQMAGGLPGPHRDPFDRMLIAQAALADLVVVSTDAVFDLYGVQRLW